MPACEGDHLEILDPNSPRAEAVAIGDIGHFYHIAVHKQAPSETMFPFCSTTSGPQNQLHYRLASVIGCAIIHRLSIV
jgi:hypothetical protein